MNNFRKRAKEHKIVVVMLLVVSVGNLTTINTADAALCPWDSIRQIYRCYAVHNYIPNIPYTNGVKSTYIVIDRTIDNQFVLSSTWALLSNGMFYEVAWKDNQYSFAHPFFTCAENGALLTSGWGTPGNNTIWTFRVHDQDKNQIWNMEVDGSGTPSVCQGNGGTTIAISLKTGYETTYDTNNISTNNYKYIFFVRDNFWYLWQSTYGSHSSSVIGPGFFVKYCGSGDANYYHSNHGKGTPPGSC